MSTKIAVSSQNKKTITGHAGKCLHFFIYNVNSEGNFEKESLTLEKDNSLHEGIHGINRAHPIFDMDILLTLSIGSGAIQKLATKGVTAYNIQENDPDMAIKLLIEGTLKVYSNHSHSHEGHQHGHAGCNCGGHSH
jgi:predicted Fe-Mo cluster-binding NifX family protein